MRISDKDYAAAVMLCLAQNDKKKAAKLLWPTMIQNSQTDRIWNALDKYPFLCIMGHGSASKSYTAAAWMLLDWWHDSHNTAVIITSDTVSSMSRRIWSDVKALLHSTRIPMPGILIDSRHIIKSSPTDDKNAIAGIAAESDDAESKIQGVHTKRIRVVIDEADNRLSGSVWKAISNLETSGELRVVALANPADITGNFGRNCEPKDGWSSVNSEVDKEWTSKTGAHVLRLDGLDSPNIVSGRDDFPFLLTNKGLNGIREKKGEDSPEWWTYVRAWFPPEGSSGVIFNKEITDRSQGIEPIWYADKVPIAACDPAFEGGAACVLGLGYTGRPAGNPRQHIVQGVRWIEIKRSDTSVPITLDFARQIKTLCLNHGVKPSHFICDGTGNALGLTDQLKIIWSGDIVVQMFGGNPTELKITQEDTVTCVDRYDRFVSELWYSAREWMKAGLVYLPKPPDDLIFELQARTYEMRRGKIRVETKDEMKDRGLKSPDYGDTCCLMVHLVRLRSGGFTPSITGQSMEARGDTLAKFKKKASSFRADYGVGGEADRPQKPSPRMLRILALPRN